MVPFFLTRTAEQQAKEIVGELSESFDSREDLAVQSRHRDPLLRFKRTAHHTQ